MKYVEMVKRLVEGGMTERKAVILVCDSYGLDVEAIAMAVHDEKGE